MNVNNKKKFFQNIALDENGNMIIVIENEAGQTSKGISQYKVFQRLQLTEEGYLKTND